MRTQIDGRISCYFNIFFSRYFRDVYGNKKRSIDPVVTTGIDIPFKGKKIYYNILLDDRAGLESAYKVLIDTIDQMK